MLQLWSAIPAETQQLILQAGPAYLLELVLFALLGAWRRTPDRWRPLLPILLPLTAILPWLMTARAGNGLDLAALFFIPAVWFAVLPRRRPLDYLFLAVMAALYLSPVFEDFYGRKLEILGRAAWIRTGIASVLLIAREEGIGFGFWPQPREWRIGVKHFLALVPFVFALGLLLRYWKWPIQPQPLRGLGLFLGTLFFVGVFEEFFFRGLLQRWAGLWTAAFWFGICHLAFRQFPNWQFVALAACAGIFYGRAFREAGSIRASIVTHACLNGLWAGLFGKA
jgi:membrane protease YdiL (CAAX protease family)